MKKLCFIYTIDTQLQEQSFATTCMQIKEVMQSKISQGTINAEWSFSYKAMDQSIFFGNQP